ncbi:thioredoxin [Candidatus Methylacidiphilum fumarolicum]|uniref:Thioredoxin n=2 Tax=Candidatus Methylacidiphilum fumarolicum TaxID=591154 RepID=I0JVM9_METFB|nr:thioredoxin [Candidatus Methylacidiphilum fumarolicum]MBW6414054.1 thioredoxin [Candidatus Methylacidiphilum fumarolicum]TFE66401.1 thioredoxin [Candidatus Methylacidiphilum fumarolicum]TFE75260.1 thioredoxin [Candidatus Methylacidiphilum fumarolicum]TFE76128.1 thioredoxin [Candidatus Methylacidiphilum fumarolicum]TFE77274.1 thioredoxin [Candidatus Methylacidiphilum fumarolicum]
MIFDVNDFEQEVIHRSKTIPVVVDFWAAWCGPCRMLSPLLEELAAEAQGKWDLAKVNVDEQEAVAVAYGVSGIPDVRIFVDGEEKDRFVGLQPKAAIKSWLEKNLSQKGQKTKWKTALDLFEQGKFHEAIVAFEKEKEKPENPQEFLIYAKFLLLSDPQKALSVLQPEIESEDPSIYEAIKCLGTLLLGMEIEKLGETEEKIRFVEGLEAIKKLDIEKGLFNWISLLHINKNIGEGLVLKAVRNLFRYLGPRHPLSLKYSRAFSTAVNV